jgi:hypothetical protein
LKVIAYDLVDNVSPISSYNYTFDSESPPSPTAFPTGAGIIYRIPVQVTLSCTESNTQIYYTLDGSTPSNSSTNYTTPITISGIDQTKTLKVIAYDLAGNASTINSYTYTFDTTPPPTPTADPTGIGAAYKSSVEVKLSCTEGSVNIYYTTDGTAPTNASSLYSVPITISGIDQTKTLQIIAYDLAGNASTINSYTYTFDTTPPPTPTADPTGIGAAYKSSVEVKLSCTEGSAKIYYTIGSTVPNSSSTLYSSPITISGTDESKTLNVVSYDLAENKSTTINTYTYVFDTKSPPMPTALPIGTDIIYRNPVEVTLSCTESNTQIYYTLDGSTPSNTSANYTTPITISGTNQTKTLKVIAYDLADNASTINSYTYTFDSTPPPAPTADPTGMGAAYKSSVEVILSCAESNTQIYYTLDGSTPSNTSANYTTPITISGTNQTKTLQIIAYDLAGNASDVSSYEYLFDSTPPPTPTADPTGIGAAYISSVEVTLSCAESNTQIYYTLDGSTPSNTSSNYTTPITISGTNQTKTLQIIAYDLAGNASDVSFYEYLFDSTPPPTPTADPTGIGAAYKSSVEVTLSCAESNAQIYYTLDGSTPSNTSANYTTPITISGTNQTKTLKIIAYDLAGNASNMSSYEYLFDSTPPSTPTASPTGEFSAYKSSVDVTLECSELDALIYYTIGADTPSNTSNQYSIPITITGTNESKVMNVIAYDLAGNASDIKSYTYVFDTKSPPLPTAYPTGENVVYKTEVIVEMFCVETDAMIRYTLTGYDPTENDELYNGPITIIGTNESITLKIRSYDLAGNYSSINTYVYNFDSIPPPTPTAIPTGEGEYFVNSSNVEIALSCEEKDVFIYFNNGEDPTSLYSSPFIISGTDEVKTLNIIAYDLAGNASNQNTYTYDFRAYAPTASVASGTYHNLSELSGISLTSYVENSVIYYTLSNTELVTIYSSTVAEGELVDMSDATSVTVKLWGAGGSGGNFQGNTGGGGGYTEYTFAPDSSALYYISVGRSGTFQGATGGLILPGGTSNTWSGGGGDATCLIKFANGEYTLMAVAGGGGAGGTTGTGDGYGGAGGGNAGQNGTGNNNHGNPSGGANGIGGYGYSNSGQDCSIQSDSILNFGGAGGNGIDINNNLSSGGGGGYGGGGSSDGSGAGGGGGFINQSILEYISGTTSSGYNKNPPNIGDTYYANNAGVGGLYGESGNNGLIVIIKEQPLPSVEYGTEYKVPFDISANDKDTITLRVRSYYNGHYSLLGSYSYYYDAYPPPSAPTANPTGEGITYLNAIIIPVTINSEQNTMVYYTLDGSTPSQDSMLYTAPLELTGVKTTFTLKVIAYNQYNIASAVNTYLYEFSSDNGSLARLGARTALGMFKLNRRRPVQ